MSLCYPGTLVVMWNDRLFVFVEKVRRQACRPLKTSFVSWSILRLWRSKNFLRWRNKWYDHLVQIGHSTEDFPIVLLELIPSFFVRHISLAFFDQPTPFPHLTNVRWTFTIHIIGVCVLLPNILVFSNRVTDCTVGVAGFAIVVFILNLLATDFFFKF